MTQTAESTPAFKPDLGSSTTVAHVLYGLHALAPFTFWSLAAIAMIIGVFKRIDVRGTWLDSHYAWLAGTFWWGLFAAAVAWTLFWVLGVLTLGIGMLVLWTLPAAVCLWYWYRVIKGWLALNDQRPVQ